MSDQPTGPTNPTPFSPTDQSSDSDTQFTSQSSFNPTSQSDASGQAAAMSQISDLQARYADELMKMPHVIGVAVGQVQQNGQPTGEISLIVLVDQKVPLTELAANEIVPPELEGIRVDVQEIGTVQAF
jgi:hypothetical protein